MNGVLGLRTPTLLVRQARVFAGVGIHVLDDAGWHWSTLSGGRPWRCGWCNVVCRVGWIADRFHGSLQVCSGHIAVDWSAPKAEHSTGTYIGAGDPIHQRPVRRKRSA